MMRGWQQNSSSWTVESNKFIYDSLVIPFTLDSESPSAINGGNEITITLSAENHTRASNNRGTLTEGENPIQGPKLSLILPLESEIHLPDGFNAATLIRNSSPNQGQYSGQLVYQLALIKINKKWVRVTTKSTNLNFYPNIEVSKSATSFTFSYQWDSNATLYIDAFDSMDFAVNDYKLWMKQAFNIPDKPFWLKNIKMVITIDMLLPDGKIANNYQNVLDLVNKMEVLKSPTTLFYIPGWNYNYDGHYPEYDPSEKLGGVAKFKEMIDTIHTKGHRIMIHTDPAAYDPYLASFEHFKQYSLGPGWCGAIDCSNKLSYDSGKQPVSRGISIAETINSPSIPTEPNTPATECSVSIGYSGKADISFSVNDRTLSAKLDNSEYTYPYTFFFNKGVNQLKFSASQNIDWNKVEYRINNCIRISDFWTYPFVAMDQSNPVWINEFTDRVSKVVNYFDIDAVHLDAHVLKSSTKKSHALFKALQNKVSKSVAIGIEENAEEFALDAISLSQQGRGVKDFSQSYLLSPLSQKLAENNFISYGHLCEKNGFVPHWVSCYLNKAKPNAYYLDRLGMAYSYKLPTFRLNYPEYGIDAEAKKQIACFADNRVICSSAQSCSGSVDSKGCCSGICQSNLPQDQAKKIKKTLE